MKKFWEFKQSAVPRVVDLYIYSAVQRDYYDWEPGEGYKKVESETSADYFRQQLEGLGELDAINIYINSMGGSVSEGVGIYNQLKRCKAQKTVYIDGFACSVASVIAMAGDKIIMPRNTVMMIHNPWIETAGNSAQLRKAADDLEVLNTASLQAYVLKCGDKCTEAELKAKMDAETYLTAMQCVELGLADEFSEVDADIASAKQMIEASRQEGIQQYSERLERIFAMAEQNQKKPEQNTGNHTNFEEKAIQIVSSFFK